MAVVCTLLKNIFLFIYFLERGEGKEKDKERNIHVWLPLAWPPTGDLAYNPGMCPDWELNWGPYGLQATAQSIESHQLEMYCYFFLILRVHLLTLERDKH